MAGRRAPVKRKPIRTARRVAPRRAAPKAIPYTIENVSASLQVAPELDLESLALRLPEAEYSPERFPGLVLRIAASSALVVLFPSGKMVASGARSLEGVDIIVGAVCDLLRSAGVAELQRDAPVEVQNIVARAELARRFNLPAIKIALEPELVEYQPERFPGLLYRLPEPKVVLLLFEGGNAIATGARSIPELESVLEQLRNELASTGLL